MVLNRKENRSLRSARPLVRYVDEQQAVIDTLFTVADNSGSNDTPAEVHVRLTGPSGNVITFQTSVDLSDGKGMVRFELGDPCRWWPAGMGDQQLYEFCITLLVGDETAGTWSTTLGMTSVRTKRLDNQMCLLVNGHEYEINDVIPIERHDENSVLPVTRDTLLLIRNHFAPDVLYEAADQAGILLIQSVPLSHTTQEQINVSREVDRLAGHPCLAGWLVNSTDRIGDRIAQRILNRDPTRSVFRHFS